MKRRNKIFNLPVNKLKMDRRKSLKVIGLSAFSSTLLLDACKEKPKENAVKAPGEYKPTIDRTPEELEHDKILVTGKIFTDHERKTIATLSDIIIPADKGSGSASEAKVPEFIETIAIDMPEQQVPLKGGIRWLDLRCIKDFGKAFIECSKQQQINLIDQIAYPAKAKPGVQQGVSFFSLVRNLAITGFYTSEMGIKDLGYQGNTPNQWNGVPDDVLKHYGLAYTDKELKECISYT
jgi:gluconate 2-dehydrogenase gamma chain